MLRIIVIIIFTFSLLGCGGGDSSDSSDENSSSNTNTGTGSSGTNNPSTKSYRLVTIIGDYDNNGNEDGRMEFEYDAIGRLIEHKIIYDGDDELDKVWVWAEGTGKDSTKSKSIDITSITYENSTDGQVKVVTQRTDTSNFQSDNIVTTNYWVTYNSDNLVSSVETEAVEFGTFANAVMEYDGTNMTSVTQDSSGFSTSIVYVYDANNRLIESKFGTDVDATQFTGGIYTYTSDGKMKSLTEGELNTTLANPVVKLSHYWENFFDGDKVDSFIRKFNHHGDSVGERYDLIYHEDGYIEEILLDLDDDGTIDGKETWVFEEQPCVLTWNFDLGHVWTFATGSMEDSSRYFFFSRMACM
jgi:hypothetical protein